LSWGTAGWGVRQRFHGRESHATQQRPDQQGPDVVGGRNVPIPTAIARRL